MLLTVPLGITGAVVAATMRGLPNDVYFTVGLITIIGLAAKDAILIIEFAKDLRAEGKSLVDATIEACSLRFRPILMTGLAFVCGVLPMVIAHGAGGASQQALGTSVMGGMIAVVILALLMVPVFFVSVQRVLAGDREKVGKAAAGRTRSGATRRGEVLRQRAEHVRPRKRRAQSFIGDMCVDLGRRYAGMTKQPLHEADIDAGLDQQCRGRMAQHVRRQLAAQARLFGENAQTSSDRVGAERAAERLRNSAPLLPRLSGQRRQLLRQRRIGDIGNPVARALAPDAQAAPCDRTSSLCSEHSSPTRRPVETIRRIAMAMPVAVPAHERRVDSSETPRLSTAISATASAAPVAVASRRTGCHTRLLAGVMKERPQTRQPPADRRRRQLSRRHVLHVALEARRRDLPEINRRPFPEVSEIKAIRSTGVRREASLNNTN